MKLFHSINEWLRYNDRYDTGLEPIEVAGLICWVGPICRAESPYNLQPALKGWSDEGVPAGSPMPKSVSSLRKGKNSTVDGVRTAYILLVGLIDIYNG